MTSPTFSGETPRQRFDRWHVHFSEAFNGYEKLDMLLTDVVASNTKTLWQENARLQAELARAKAESWDGALRECLGMLSLLEDQGADVTNFRERVIGLLQCKPASPGQSMPTPSNEDLGKLRTSADGSIVASW